MLATMDRAWRLVVPHQIRKELGLVPGEVEIVACGADVLIRQSGARLVEEDGLLLLPPGEAPLSADDVRELRLVNQR